MNRIQKINYIKENIVTYNISHEMIYGYIIDKGISFIKNSNGIFFTINQLSDQELQDMYDIIFNYIQTNKYIEYDLSVYDDLKKQQKNIIHNHIVETNNPIFIPFVYNFTNVEKKIMNYSYHL